LFAVDDLKVMPLAAEIIAEVDRHHPDLDDVRRGAELVRELISHLIGAVVAEARRRLDAARPNSVEDIRHHGEALIAFPAPVAEAEAAIKSFLKARMYRHRWVMRVMGDAEALVRDLFERYQNNPADLPPEWLPPESASETETGRIRRIANFIAGMT